MSLRSMIDEVMAGRGTPRSTEDQAEYQIGVALGIEKERRRIASIFALAEAEHRYPQAKALALSDEEVSPELAKTLLAGCPVLPATGEANSALDMSFNERVPKSTAEAFAHGQELARKYGRPPSGSASASEPQPLPPLSTKPVSAMTTDEAMAHGAALAARYGRH